MANDGENDSLNRHILRMLCFNQCTNSSAVNYKQLTFVLLVKVLRSKWKDNIKMDLKGIGCEGLGWINLIQEREK